MRYQESKERSAEVLRTALAHMGQHDASYNPMTFAVWYEFVAGINARLNQAVDECLRSAVKIDDETIARLYNGFIAEVDDQTIRQISAELQRVMTGMAENATSTGKQAGVFGEQMGGLAAALKSSNPTALAPMLDRALAGAVDMKGAAQALEQHVATSRLEIERLRSDLTRARDEALLDPLTHLLNRRGFDKELEAMLAREPAPDAPHCLIMLDIDRFKSINDGRGHVMGDRVIQALGEMVRACVTDPRHHPARYGGDEFAILLPDSGIAAGLELAETVRQRVKAMTIRDRRTKDVVETITISAGVAAMRHGDDAAGLIGRADAALYQSKQAGRDRVTGADTA